MTILLRLGRRHWQCHCHWQKVLPVYAAGAYLLTIDLMSSSSSSSSSLSSIKPLCAAGCGKDGILRCVRCLDALYCNKECQAKMWQQHKGPCKEMAAVKEKAKADEAAEAKGKQDADDIQTLCSAGCGRGMSASSTSC